MEGRSRRRAARISIDARPPRRGGRRDAGVYHRRPARAAILPLAGAPDRIVLGVTVASDHAPASDGAEEVPEQRMRSIRPRFELGMELGAEHERVILDLG